MKKRSTIFEVKTTRVFKSDSPAADEAKTFDLNDSVSVLAADAEDAIARAKTYFDQQDRRDGDLKRRISLTINSVVEGVTLDIV